jgi:DNA-binding transcriptional LysR family regulator
MEMFELRYFMAVAKIENLNRAAQQINASPASLSKAISRLEEELQTPLFFRSGRGIRLTPEGQLLKKHASQILQLEENARFELRGKETASLNIYISSEEILQAGFGPRICEQIEKLFPMARIHFLIRTEDKAIEQVRAGEAHLALISQDSPSDMFSKIISKVEFQTCASKRHPLYKEMGSKSIPIEAALKHSFVSPESAILGKISKSSSVDGWRDDKFPRQIKYRVCGLKLMENLIQDGMALGYLPDYFVKSADLVPLKIMGCPYSCHQTIRILTKDPSGLGWLNQLWSRL